MPHASTDFVLPKFASCSFIKLQAGTSDKPLAELSDGASKILEGLLSLSLETLNRDGSLKELTNDSKLARSLQGHTAESSSLLKELEDKSYISISGPKLRLTDAAILNENRPDSRNQILAAAILTNDNRNLILQPEMWLRSILDGEASTASAIAQKLNVTETKLASALEALCKTRGYVLQAGVYSHPVSAKETLVVPKEDFINNLRKEINTDLKLEIVKVFVGNLIASSSRELDANILYTNLKDSGLMAPPNYVLPYKSDGIFGTLQSLTKAGILEQVDPKKSGSKNVAKFSLSSKFQAAFQALPEQAKTLEGFAKIFEK